MDERYLMIALRLFHIVGGVFWVGAVAAIAWFVIPAQSGLGESAGKFMEDLMVRRKLRTFIGATAVLTVLSGIVMYGRLAMVSDGAFARSRTGMVLGLGAVIAILALGIGGGVAGRSAAKMAKIAGEIKDSGAPPTDAQRAEIAALQARQAWALRTVGALLTVTVATMAIARYV